MIVAQLDGKFQQIAAKEGPNHPQYRQAQAELGAAREQLAKLIKQYTTGLTSTAENAEQRLAKLQQAQTAQKQRVLQLTEQRAHLDILQRGVDNAQRIYDLAMQKLAESAMESSSNATNIAVLKAAPEPTKHSKPRLLLNLILAMFLGGCLGVGFALLLELQDRRIRAAADLEQLLKLPVLVDLSHSAGKPALS